jgi:hypothetical protein
MALDRFGPDALRQRAIGGLDRLLVLYFASLSASERPSLFASKDDGSGLRENS